ncbi:acetylserotonin O-methyltransferase [Halomonas llamarensis]|uniref:Acetylserotonin O-methyltransferase n=1 Tax=Halomonas llamarensis TaxID=2945104 RepID=A0ABT0SSB2_9GAMM|nr:acetylserotonin O-methyltransferase [Halomonas llamarensis]MCL7930516.1 acetylserotonin O-methyltransferase [Halomonas llamarensis]
MNHAGDLLPHALQPYWDLALASVQAEALQLALEEGLFETLQQPHSAATLANARGWRPVSVEHWLTLLWSMRLIDRHRDAAGEWRYISTHVAQRYLASSSPLYCGEAWRFRLASLRDSGAGLSEGLHEQGRSATLASGERWAAAARSHLAREQISVTAPAACEVVAQRMSPEAAWRLLDLGGGPGLVAVALAKAFPQMSGVVFELPEAADVAAQHIAQAGLASRLEARGGDVVRDGVGTGYDLIWCSSVLHFVPDLSACLAKLHAALKPGGELICVHAEIPDEPEAARRMLSYYLPLLWQGRRVTQAGELCEALSAQDFEVCEERPITLPMAPATALVARRRVK